MLTNKKLLIYHGTDASVTQIGSEGTSGASRVDERAEGDARFLAAHALGFMGKKARRPEVLAALREAKKDKDSRLREEAANALKLIE